MSSKTAIKIMLSLLATVVLFHLAILTKIIPYDITWGGRLQSDAEMYVFETISILVNVLIANLLLIKGEYIKPFISLRVINILLWVLIVLFALNTIGNLFAETLLEKFFALVTLAFGGLLWAVVRRGRA